MISIAGERAIMSDTGSNRRVTDRRKMLKSAKIVFNKRQSVFDCFVRDLSSTGAKLNVGDLVANVGTLDRLRVRVYVDEPLLGRVRLGEPVIIRWEAIPGKTWTGAVDQMPASIQTLGSKE